MVADVTSGESQRTLELAVKYTYGPDAVEWHGSASDASFGYPRVSSDPENQRTPFADWWRAFLTGPRVRSARDAHPVRFVDLFSSVGGLSIGAMEAITAVGLKAAPVFAADVDERALQVYKANVRPREVSTGSVRDMFDFRVSGAGEGAVFAYEPMAVDPRLASLRGSVDVILAGPPCQGHSSLNNHSRHSDPKNLLYLTVPAAAVALDARHVIVENVPNVVADRRGVVQTTIALLKANGYNVTSGVMAADKLGWPQTRRRFFLVASRGSVPIGLDVVTAALATEALPVSWALKDLQDVKLDDADVMNSVPRLSAENTMRVNWLHDNDEYDLPNAIRPDCHKEGTTYGATYGRMHADRPAPTLTGGFLTPGRGRFVHPTQARVLTPREAARIQGFPDWFTFAANPARPPARTEVGQWIGNAVPSILGFAATLAALAGEAAAAADSRPLDLAAIS